MRIYYFETPSGEIIDAQNSEASICFHEKRFKYIGWSDNRFMSQVKKIAKPYDSKGSMKPPTLKERKVILDALAQEIDFARNNPDRTPPPYFGKMDMDGNPQSNPDLNRLMSNR